MSALRGAAVFPDILVHDVVVEFERVLKGQVIVDLAALGLNHVGLIWAGDVRKLILLSRMDLAAEEFLVSKSSVFLCDQSFGGRCMLFDV